MGARKVFILDDSEPVLLLSAQVLRQAGYELAVAKDFSEMAAVLGRFRPDVVLLDVMMPEGFGYDLVDYVRHRLGIDAPVLLFSSMDPQLLENYVRQFGADGYITKGEDLSHLALEVQRWADAAR
ncbi:MAG: response regulator [Myxococcota bacterium]